MQQKTVQQPIVTDAVHISPEMVFTFNRNWCS